MLNAFEQLARPPPNEPAERQAQSPLTRLCPTIYTAASLIERAERQLRRRLRELPLLQEEFSDEEQVGAERRGDTQYRRLVDRESEDQVKTLSPQPNQRAKKSRPPARAQMLKAEQEAKKTAFLGELAQPHLKLSVRPKLGPKTTPITHPRHVARRTSLKLHLTIGWPECRRSMHLDKKSKTDTPAQHQTQTHLPTQN
jgi:hypothetical protein